MRALHSLAVLVIAALAAPAWAKDLPAEKTVICKDGSTSKGGKGACSGHGGVDKKATQAAAPKEETKKDDAREQEGTKKERKSESEREAAGPSAPGAEGTVICKDGSTSNGGRGACRGHGGVDKKASGGGAKGTAPAAGAAAAAPPPATPPPSPPPPASPPPAAARPAATPPARPAQDETSARTTPKNTDPTGASAKCKDGTYSHAKHHTGACSNHGGVAEWLDEPAKQSH